MTNKSEEAIPYIILARTYNDMKKEANLLISPKQDDWKDPISGESIAHGMSGFSLAIFIR